MLLILLNKLASFLFFSFFSCFPHSPQAFCGISWGRVELPFAFISHHVSRCLDPAIESLAYGCLACQVKSHQPLESLKKLSIFNSLEMPIFHAIEPSLAEVFSRQLLYPAAPEVEAYSKGFAMNV